jgi:anti-sigma factor RsiW
VSSGTEHREFSESLAAYALGALPEDESARIREHLAGCHECRAELEWLRAAVDTLPASVPQVEAPPELRSRVMDAVEREAELLNAAGDAADRPEPAPPRRRWWPSISVRPSVVLVGLCVAAIVVGGVILSLNSTVTRNTRTIHAQVTGRTPSSSSAASRPRPATTSTSCGCSAAPRRRSPPGRSSSAPERSRSHARSTAAITCW